MGAYMLLYPFNRINTLIIFYFIVVFRLPAVGLLGLWFLWQLVQGVSSLAISDQVSVAFLCPRRGVRCGAIIGSRSQISDETAGVALSPPASTVGLLVPVRARTGLIFFGTGRVTRSIHAVAPPSTTT